MKSAARVFVLCLSLAGCELAPTTEDAAATACDLAPVADEILTQARLALAAARGGDRDAMLAATGAVSDGVSQIFAAAGAEEPQPSPDPLLSSLLTTAYFGEQVTALFGNAVPNPEDLASYEATLLGALDLSAAEVRTAAADCPAS